MKRVVAMLAAVVVSLAGASRAFAQESVPGAGAVVVTVIPVGGTFFTEGKNTKAPSFGNYGLGGAVAYHFNKFIAVEGDVIAAIGVTQNLDFPNGTSNLKTPNLLDYSGSVVVSAANHSSWEPYVAGGVGGLTAFNQSAVAITDSTTFLTGNIGGGVKWFNKNARWGFRADYRFEAVRQNDSAPAFFGQETRFGHRVYGAVLINVGK